MNLVVAIYSALLFFVLSPNVFLRLPQNGSKMMVAAVHAGIFALVLYFTQKTVWKLSVGLEGMDTKKKDDSSNNPLASM
jgi:hypothetical protein